MRPCLGITKTERFRHGILCHTICHAFVWLHDLDIGKNFCRHVLSFARGRGPQRLLRPLLQVENGVGVGGSNPVPFPHGTRLVAPVWQEAVDLNTDNAKVNIAVSPLPFEGRL